LAESSDVTYRTRLELEMGHFLKLIATHEIFFYLTQPNPSSISGSLKTI